MEIISNGPSKHRRIDKRIDLYRELVHIVHICLLLYMTPEDFKDLIFSRNDNIDQLIDQSINIMIIPVGVVLILIYYSLLHPAFMLDIGMMEILLMTSTGVGSYLFAIVSLRSTLYDLLWMFDKQDVSYEVNIAMLLMYKVWGTIFAALALFLLVITTLPLSFPIISELGARFGDSSRLFSLFVMLIGSLFFIGLSSTVKIFVAAFLFVLLLVTLFYVLILNVYYLLLVSPLYCY